MTTGEGQQDRREFTTMTVRQYLAPGTWCFPKLVRIDGLLHVFHHYPFVEFSSIDWAINTFAGVSAFEHEGWIKVPFHSFHQGVFAWNMKFSSEPDTLCVLCSRGMAFLNPSGGGFGQGGGGSGGSGGKDRGGGGREWLNEADIAAVCPEVSHHAVHLPLRILAPGHPAATKAVRVLRLCRELCRVLPSKERAPYLVVAEVLQTSFRWRWRWKGLSLSLSFSSSFVGVFCARMFDVCHNGYRTTLPLSLAPSSILLWIRDGWSDNGLTMI